MNKDLHKLLSAIRKGAEEVNRELPRMPFYEMLCGMCLICGTAMKIALDQLQLSDKSTQLVHGLCCDFDRPYSNNIPNHCWVEHQGENLDITATQFGEDFYDFFGRKPKRVEILPIGDEIVDDAYYRTEIVPCSTIEEAYAWSHAVAWTTYQCPYPDLVKRILDKAGLVVV